MSTTELVIYGIWGVVGPLLGFAFGLWLSSRKG